MTVQLLLDVAVLTLLWAGVGAAWNLLAGYGGQFSLGHGAFFGIGAYTSALLFVKFGISPWLGLFVGAFFAALFAVLVGVVSMRTRGPFFTLITIAFAEVVRILTVYAADFTRGSQGLIIPFEPSFGAMIFQGKLPYVTIAAAYAILALATCSWVRRNRLGFALLANREDEDAARALGVFTLRARLKAAALSAALTGAGGTIFAQYTLFIDPNSTMSFLLSVKPALIAIIGGLGLAAGPLLGAIIVVPLEYLLRAWFGGMASGLHGLIFGSVLIIILLTLPEGLLKGLSDLARRVWRWRLA